MVAKKAPKTAKVSYAQRVLGAFTQIQRDHKKSAIHDATIRAQVKKNALENKEKLGPNWARWVGVALKKLEDNGLLEYSRSAARNITLTPSGKKAISEARQSLSTLIETSPSDVPNDLIWKHIFQSSSTARGKKRGHLSIRTNDDSSDEPASRRVIRSKRARVSGADASPSRPSKAQVTKLQAELRALQKEKEDGLWLRESSPLTDLDMEEEASRLRDELQVKEAELQRVKRELAGKVSQTEPYRPLTPTIETRPSTPTPIGPAIPTHPRPLDRVRTQSGSFISLLSRQPTPPRSPGGISDTFPELGEDEHGTGMHEDSNTQDLFSETQIAFGDPRVKELERDPASGVAEIRRLETQVSQLHTNIAEAQQAVLDRDQQLSTLSVNLSKLQSDIARKELEWERRIAELENLKAGSEQSYSLRLASLEQNINERKAMIETLTEKKKKNSAELDAFRNSLSAVEQEKTALVSRLAESESQAQELRLKVESQETLQHKVSSLQEDLRSLQEAKDSVDQSLAAAHAQSSLLSEKLQGTEASNESLLRQLTNATDDISSLREEFQISEDKVVTLSSQVLTLGNSISQGLAQIDDLTRSLVTAEQEGANLRQQVTENESLVSRLQSDLAISNKNAEEVAGDLAAIVKERSELLVQLEMAHMTISASEGSLNEVKERLATVEDRLITKENRAAELQENLNLTAEKLNAEVEVNRKLAEVVKEKEAQLAQLTQDVSTATSLSESYSAKLATSEITTQDLRSRLTQKGDDLKKTQDLLASTQDTHAIETAKMTAKLTDLEGHILSARAEINVLQSHLSTAHSEKQELQDQLNEQAMELGQSKAKLLMESQRADKLDADFNGATDKLKEAEQEVLDLRELKAADEATIENLKGLFSTHVEKQTETLAALNSQVISTKSSPAPVKRRSTRTMGKMAIPFNLK